VDLIGVIETITQNPFFLKYGMIGLFLNGLLSAVVPIPTELTTSALLAGGESKLRIFVTLASSSVIGGFLAYYIGRTGNKLFKFFYKTPTQQDEQQSHDLITKHGWIAIFFCSWIPILGDVIPIVAGAKKYNFRRFTIAMSAGKAIKVLVIVYISSFLTTTFLR
jgi:membrane protein YqaA with SNARE-associated domain